MAREKAKQPAIKIYNEAYNLSENAREFLGGKFKSIEEQEREERRKKLREKLSKKPFGGKYGFRGGGINTSAKSGTKAIKKLFGYN